MLRTRTVQVGFSFRQPCMDILRTRMSFSRLILLAAEEMFCPMSQNIHTTRFIERNVVCCCVLEHGPCEWLAACARIQQSGRSTPRAQRKRKRSIEQRGSAQRETAWRFERLAEAALGEELVNVALLEEAPFWQRCFYHNSVYSNITVCANSGGLGFLGAHALDHAEQGSRRSRHLLDQRHAKA